MTSRDAGPSSDPVPSDADLMRQLAEGDTAALASLVRRYQSRVRGLAYRVLGNVADADDVAQETFMRVWRGAGPYADSGHFATWLMRIAANLCIDRKRHSRHEVSGLNDEMYRIPARPEPAAGESAEIIDAVSAAVAELPERQRLAMVLHRYEDKSYRQIAELTGWSESAVESLLVRAYANLRQKLSALVKIPP